MSGSVLPIDGERDAVIEPRFRLRPFNEVLLSTAAAYLVKGLIPRSGLAVIWGPPKSGKSFWTFDLALHVALGWSYRGRKVSQGPVVYFVLEGEAGTHARIEAFRQGRLSNDPAPIPFYIVPTRLDLVKDVAELIECIRRQLSPATPALIVIDTLNRSLAGSESDDRDMGAYVRAADAVREAFGCAVAVVHHSGIDASRPRGHTSLTGAADAQLGVKRDAGGNIIVTLEWLKDGVEGATIVSRLQPVEVGTDADGDPITSCVVEAVDEPAALRLATTKAPNLPKGAKIALKALHKALSEAGEAAPTSNHVPAGVRVVTVELWRAYAYRQGISDGEERAKQRAFKRAFEHLVGNDAVAVWDEHVWLTR